MPVFTISAVNTGTDQLTAVAHGLLTGDRFRLRNIGGALPAATPALAAVTDYFAIRIDADNIKVSDTNAHALAGTGIFDITGAGTGTQLLEYGLPYCVPTASAAPLTQIKSANDTAAWNALVAIYDLLTGQAQSVWTTLVVALTVTFSSLVTFALGAAAAANQHFTVSGTGLFKHGSLTICRSAFGDSVQSGSVGPSGNIWRLGVGGVLWIPLPSLAVGKRVLAVRLRAKDGTGSAITAQLQSDVDGTATTIATQTTGGTNTLQTIPFASLSTVIAAGTVYGIRATSPGTTTDYYRVEVDYDQP